MSAIERLVLWLHVAFVIFTIGPVTIAIMSSPRAIRTRNVVVFAAPAGDDQDLRHRVAGCPGLRDHSWAAAEGSVQGVADGIADAVRGRPGAAAAHHARSAAGPRRAEAGGSAGGPGTAARGCR